MKIIDVLQLPQYSQKNVLEKLICAITKRTKTQLFVDSDLSLAPEELERIDRAYTDYAIHQKPLEYILGYVEFLGVRFQVTPATLIPRPETEYMIIAVNEHLQTSLHTNEQATIIDVGTGCGVLGLSVSIHNKGKIKELLLTELSADALHIAKRNYETVSQDYPHVAQTLTLFVEANLVDAPELTQALQKENPITLVANLPYIPDQTFDENVEDNVKKREPRMAFVGGKDGLDLYRIMFDQIIAARQKSNIGTDNAGNIHSTDMSVQLRGPFTMFLEMMTRQVDILREEYKNIFTFDEVKTFHFNIRIVKAIFSL